ncbi:hypothetical protein [Desulfosporosinus sp. OT]|uniref:hypothetical protein n=1 Tax=Desulfosporosinus sp. OT TaxID=913865 RepID=UPI0002239C98|nr:hypothetical protein [Desulfosporosinus sp. OT]EGW40146.1 putative membrane protein [Desulfosporosinus sp. OT]
MYAFFQSIFQGLLNGLISIAHWFGSIILGLFNAIKSFFTALFGPIILLLGGIWYLITNIFEVIVLIIKVVIGLLSVVFAIFGGVLNTFSGLMGFSGSTSYYALPGAYQQGFNTVTGFISQTGFNTIAYIMATFVWLATAYAVIKIAGGNGGN